MGWFSTKCPLDTWEKTWTEYRMRWLAEHFGIARLTKAEVILPTEEFFQGGYDGTPEHSEQIMKRLRRYMGVHSRKIDLGVCDPYHLPEAAPNSDASSEPTIGNTERHFDHLLGLVATLAHALADEMLLGGGILSAEAPDYEGICDLLPVYFGLGVFGANATVSFKSADLGTLSWWIMTKQGYLPSRVFGYALALFALFRQEEQPEWARYLRRDASSALQAGLRFLSQTGDSIFHPETFQGSRRLPSISEILNQLETGTPSVRLATLWDIRDHALTDRDMVPAVLKCLNDPDPAIPGEAARTLAALRPVEQNVAPLLIRALRSPHESICAGAAHALGSLRLQPEVVIPELGWLLRDGNRTVVAAASKALCQFGFEAESEAPRLLPPLTKALVECDEPMEALLASTLLAVAPDPKHYIHKHFAPDNAELRRSALRALKKQDTRRVHQDPPPNGSPRQTNFQRDFSGDDRYRENTT